MSAYRVATITSGALSIVFGGLLHRLHRHFDVPIEYVLTAGALVLAIHVCGLIEGRGRT